ncbi:MAG: hypothetical protein JJP05_03205 [cyanobacterium endosymbiont of Rhopalodia gibba]
MELKAVKKIIEIIAKSRQQHHLRKQSATYPCDTAVLYFYLAAAVSISESESTPDLIVKEIICKKSSDQNEGKRYELHGGSPA